MAQGVPRGAVHLSQDLILCCPCRHHRSVGEHGTAAARVGSPANVTSPRLLSPAYPWWFWCRTTPSGCLPLDTALSGGYPVGRVVEVRDRPTVQGMVAAGQVQRPSCMLAGSSSILRDGDRQPAVGPNMFHIRPRSLIPACPVRSLGPRAAARPRWRCTRLPRCRSSARCRRSSMQSTRWTSSTPGYAGPLERPLEPGGLGLGLPALAARFQGQDGFPCSLAFRLNPTHTLFACPLFDAHSTLPSCLACHILPAPSSLQGPRRGH